jgi:iron complex transport system substrate-binding protein
MKRLVVGMCALAMVAAACGGDDESSTTEAPLVSTSPAPAPTTTAGATTPEPTPTTIAIEPAERIISLSPTATEMVFAIGAGDLLIAVDDQ